MKLKRLKCKVLAQAKGITVSPSYIIGCTGRRAVILDRQYNLIQYIEGLDYVYSAQVSPDEKHLLLISNVNKFYVADLATFQKAKVLVRAPYNYNLEGNGCWSFDGKKILIPVLNGKNLLSTLRCYHADNLQQYEELLVEKYCLTILRRLELENKYLFVGYDRSEQNKHYFIYFDGEGFEIFPLKDLDGMLPMACDVDEVQRIVTLYSFGGCFRYTADGKKIGMIRHPEPKPKTISSFDVFSKLFKNKDEMFTDIEDFVSEGIENIEASVDDYIHKYGISSCGRYIYMASKSGFYLLDRNSSEVLAKVPEEYGVQDFVEMAQGSIAITTWSGAKLYQIVDT